MTIKWPSNTKDIIDEIRGVIGRDVEFVKNYPGENCPLCSLDPLTRVSTDPFCPICSGHYYITTTSSYLVPAHINWTSVDGSRFEPGGRIHSGDCKITVEYTDENLDLVNTAAYIVVDEKIMYVEKYDLKGVQALNRIAVELMQDPRR